MAKALGNIKVLDFTRHFAGPFCTMLLKDLGADIIKVEMPEVGDGCRSLLPLTQGLESYIFVNLNRGKKSITLNLKSEQGCQIARNLAGRVDVVVENFTPGVMDRLGLGYEELSKLNPGLIYAASCGFGHTGPRSAEPAFDPIIQAAGGLVSINGRANEPPLRVSLSVADYLAGFYLSVAILAALNYRSVTGEGQIIDISMQDCVWSLVATEYAPSYFLTHENPKQLGNDFIGSAPVGIFPAKDAYVVLNPSTVEQWESFLRIIGREDLIGFQKWYTSGGRAQEREKVNALVEERTRTMNAKELLSKLKKARVPCSDLPTFEKVANDPQLLNRDMIIEVEQALSGKLKVPGSVFKLSKTPGDAKFPAPFLGEHNYEVYSSLLGYGDQEITKLAEEGII